MILIPSVATINDFPFITYPLEAIMDPGLWAWLIWLGMAQFPYLINLYFLGCEQLFVFDWALMHTGEQALLVW